MNTVNDTYAVFQADQVLTEAHLNDLFDYVDEQERLTRANLIGIGIVCGLDVTVDAGDAAVRLTKGCGVTSQGYLAVEPADVTLVAWKKYELPEQLPYPTFRDAAGKQLDLWELFPAGEPGAQPLSGGGLPLQDMAIVLFLELNQQGMRTCSPNDCDDRGASVTATLRRLLIRHTDLAEVIAASTGPNAGITPGGIEAGLLARLKLPDLRMPRVDVPNSGPVTSEDVLAAFQAGFRDQHLVARTAAALKAAYQAFKPLVGDAFPTDPFVGFKDRFGFLDTAPATTGQVRFLQYYWDLFDDLLRAYEEFRWAGYDLLCACCPPGGLFPRHLMLGVLKPSTVAEPAAFRHRFLASPVLGRCAERSRDVLMLFRRLVVMAERFTDEPPLQRLTRGPDRQIRVTPSVWGPGPLSDGAIPYYYRQDGAVPLHQVWDTERSRRGRAAQNLSYRADEYGPDTPDFVTDPLRFSLQPYNFLRVEGHLGKPMRIAMDRLLAYKAQYRLPIEVLALRTGAFDENAPVDLTKENCRFDDVEAIYATLKAELVCSLCKQVRYFYGLPSDFNSAITEPRKPTLQLLRDCAPDFQVQPRTAGRLIEDMLQRPFGFPIGPGPLSPGTAFAILTYALVTGLSSLAGTLSQDLRHLDFDAFEKQYHVVVDVAGQFEAARAEAVEKGDDSPFSSAGLEDRMNDILYHCRLDPFRALEAEYLRRFRQTQQAQFLSTFLHKHPGIQHHGGVPIGGTFILVYHESLPTAVPVARVVEEEKALSVALGRLRFVGGLAGMPEVQEIFQMLTGEILVELPVPTAVEERVYVDAVAELTDGAVIADFFLPYICCSDCSPIHFTLGHDRPRLDLRLGCTDARGNAQVEVIAQDVIGAVSVQVDGGAFEESTGKLLLAAGAHTVVIRNDEGVESAPVPIVVPAALTMGPAQVTEEVPADTYQVALQLSGGTPPYSADPGEVAGTTYTSPVLKSGEAVTVTVTDAAGCTTTENFRHLIERDCEAIREGFLFWVPQPTRGFPLNNLVVGEVKFLISGPPGDFDLSSQVTAILNPAPKSIRDIAFAGVVDNWMAAINGAIEVKLGGRDRVRVEYVPSTGEGLTGSLFVDRLQSHNVTISLDVTYTQGGRNRHLQMTYTAKGTLVTEPEADTPEVVLLPFGQTTSNKCLPEPPIDLCRDLDLKVDFTTERVRDATFRLSAQTSGASKPANYLWEVQDAKPALANGADVTVFFDPIVPTEKLVRLTVAAADGCTRVVVRRIDIRD